MGDAVDPRRLARLLESRKRWVVLAAFSLGFLAAMGQAPFGFAPASVAGLIGGFALLRAAPGFRRAALTGWGFGAGYFTLTLIWIVQPFLVDIARHGWMAPFALLFMAGGLALFWAAGFSLARWLSPGRWGWIGWPVAMSMAELARGVVFTGFPWGGVGAVWVGTPLMQLASVIGASGLGFLTFLVAAALYTTLTTPRRLLWTGVTLAGFLAAFGLGWQRQADPVAPRPEPVALRLIQPNAAQHLKWHPDHALEFVDRQLELTARAPAPGAKRPDLVIWPETAIPYLLEDAGPVLSEIAASANVPVVLGVQRREGQRYFNSLVVLDRNAEVDHLYDKHHLVPFGEYTPAGGLLHRLGLRGFAARYGNGYSPGPGARVLNLGDLGKILPLICYEAIFPRDLRAAPERADWILQVTNDAWFGTFSGPQQHLAQAQLRAVELGLPFVRAANTGISAVIDARGRIVARLALNRPGLLDADLPAALPKTPYARAGNAPLALALIVLFAGLVFWRGRKTD